MDNTMDTRISLLDLGITQLPLGQSSFLLYSDTPVCQGGSCLVYRAMKQMGTGVARKVILKEFYPISARRLADGQLEIPPSAKERQAQFCKSADLFNRLHNEDALNQSIAEAQEVLEANGTVYIVVDYNSGCILEDALQKETLTLYERLSILHNLAHILAQLHQLGYIHMDMKPNNILCHENQRVRLIDADTFLFIDRIRQHKDIALSTSPGYGAPELMRYAQDLNYPAIRRQFARYAKQVDVYSFGAVAYRSIFGSTPDTSLDRKELEAKLRSFEPYLPGKAISHIHTLLEKTLANLPVLRFGSMDDIIALLDEILPLVNPKEVRLAENFLPNPYPLVGRDEQLTQVRSAMVQQSGKSRILCITGMGGIGKSALARYYGEVCREDYDIIAEVSAHCASTDGCSAQNALLKLRFHNWEAEGDTEADRCEKIMQTLTSLNQKYKTLLIIHDYDTSSDPRFGLWSALGCDVILTSRHDWSGSEIPTVKLECSDLSPENAEGAAREIFFHYYTLDAEASGRTRLQQFSEKEDAALDALLSRLNYHPLGIKLIARQMAFLPGEELSPSQMLEELDKIGLEEDSPVEFQNRKDAATTSQNTYGHLAAIFRSAYAGSRLRPKDRDALRYMILVTPDMGISTKRFEGWTGLEPVYLERLRRMGWLEYLPQQEDLLDDPVCRGTYVMPLVIQEVLCKEPDMVCTTKNCKPFMEAVMHFRPMAIAQMHCRLAVYEQREHFVRMLAPDGTKAYIYMLQQAAGMEVFGDDFDLYRKKATAYWRRCVDLSAAFPEDHLLRAQCLAGLSSACALLEDMENAQKYVLESIALLEQVGFSSLFSTGEQAEQTTNTLIQLGMVLHECGSIQALNRMLLQFWFALREVKEELSMFFATIEYYIGNCFRLCGQHRAAEYYICHAIGIAKKEYPSDPVPVARVMGLFLIEQGDLYMEQGRLEQSQKALEQAYELIKPFYGESHTMVGTVLDKMANVCVSRGNMEAAVKYHTQAAVQYLEDHTSNYEVARLLVSVALDYQYIPKLQEKLPSAWETVFDTYNRIQHAVTVKDADDVLQVIQNRADSKLSKGMVRTGLHILEERAHLCRRIHGDSKISRDAYLALGDTLRRYGFPKRARYFKRIAKKIPIA